MPRMESDVKLDFKDVLVRPKRSTLKSRAEVALKLSCFVCGSQCVCVSSYIGELISICVCGAGGPPQRVCVQKLEEDVQWSTHHCLEHGHCWNIRNGLCSLSGH